MAFNVKPGSAGKQMEDDQGDLQNPSWDVDDDEAVSALTTDAHPPVGSNIASGDIEGSVSVTAPPEEPIVEPVQAPDGMNSVAAALRGVGRNADPSEVLSVDEALVSEPVQSPSETTPEIDDSVASTNDSSSASGSDVGEDAAKKKTKPSLDTVPVTTTYGKMDRPPAVPSGGVGGGGGIFSGIASGISRGVGKTFRFAGGQRLADHINAKTDPAALARSIWNKRWGAFNKTVKQMDALAERRSSEVSAFNNAVTKSAAGKKIAQFAQENNRSLNEVFGHLESGGQAPPEILASFETLRSDSNVKKFANKLDSSAKTMMTLGDRSIKQLTELHTAFPDQTGADFQLNRIDTATKLFHEEKPLEITALGPKNSENGREEPPANTKEMREKFEEFMDRIREAISNLIQQLMSKLRMK